MKSDPMIEGLARAMVQKAYESMGPSDHWEKMPEGTKQIYIGMAKTSLEYIDAGGLREAIKALHGWVAYDAMLRTLTGDVLLSGQMPDVDAAYDDCVSATLAALAKVEGSP